MKGYIQNIEDVTKENTNFRKVLYTAKLSQLVVMSLKPGEDIGMEVHDDTDQFIRIEEGKGKSILDGVETPIEDDFAVVIPAGTEHNIVNESDEEMKLYTIYSPAHHRHDVVHANKEEAEADDEHFDGTTTE
ncbi:cupin domain-containing protein [Patescibacteria group bacterium]|nr:cupin domain-containing protein [Patescibacteria group bacterium]